MADKTTFTLDEASRPFGPDYEQSIRPEVLEIYGPKINVTHTDREVRVAFGTIYTHVASDGTQSMETRYKAAVYMPHFTAWDLYFVLGSTLHELGLIAEPPASPAHDAGQEALALMSARHPDQKA